MPRLEIPIGTRFGRLVVLREVPAEKRGYKWYRAVLCRCDCGIEKTALLKALLAKSTTSCGCRCKPKVVVGERFGRLTVLAEVAPVSAGKESKRAVLCLCQCGAEKVLKLNSLRSGIAKSCGCLRKQVFLEGAVTHGESGSLLHIMWKNIKQRCGNNKSEKYHNYGGRGIYLYPEWAENYSLFRDYMNAVLGPRPEGATLDRINNDQGYCPGNLRWAFGSDQNNNKRSNVVITAFDKTQTLSQWADEISIPYSALYYRIQAAKWPVEHALTLPSSKRASINEPR